MVKGKYYKHNCYQKTKSKSNHRDYKLKDNKFIDDHDCWDCHSLKLDTSKHTSKDKCQEALCGNWTFRSSMLEPRYNHGSSSGPDQNATGSQGIDSDPRVYVIGGMNETGPLATCEKYDPNDNSWTNIVSLPRPLSNCSTTYAADYGTIAETLGYIYAIGGGEPNIFRYNIKDDLWEEFPIPFNPVSSILTYLDDFGGPLAELFIAITSVDLPACSDTQSLWAVGGDGTEQDVWYIESNTKGELIGDWVRGPDLPLFRKNPLIGRVFWRDASITSFGVSNCASIIVAGGKDENDNDRSEIQLLVRKDCNWQWIYPGNNPTNIPNDILTLATPVSKGAFGTEQWPETLVTGGRPILFGGEPPKNGQSNKVSQGNNVSKSNGGSVQFSQLRFFEGRFQRDACLFPEKNSNNETAWNLTTDMPGFRTNFATAPLSQENSSIFGGRRISRFLCTGGLNSEGKSLDRVQLFQLPVPTAFLIAREDSFRCQALCNGNNGKSNCCC